MTARRCDTCGRYVTEDEGVSQTGLPPWTGWRCDRDDERHAELELANGADLEWDAISGSKETR